MNILKSIGNYLSFIFLILILIGISLLVSGKISYFSNVGNTKIGINEYTLSGVIISDCNGKEIVDNNINLYIDKKNDNNSGDWISFLAILSTFLAAFFIYSSWKIDNDLRKISDVKNNIKNIENEAIDNMEFSNQLKYSIHYMMSKQYNKAIDALIILRSESFTLKDDRKLNSCLYFLAVSYYEQGLIDNDLELIAKAVQFINEAIDSTDHPLKIEICRN